MMQKQIYIVLGLIYLSIIQNTLSQQITLTPPTSSTTPLIAEDGSWSLTGQLDFQQTPESDYRRALNIKIGVLVCSVDLDDCTSINNPPPADPVNTCFCYGQTGDVYSFYVRQEAVASESGDGLTAEVLLNVFGSPLSQQETLPQIFSQVTVTYQLGTASSKSLLSTQNETVLINEDISLKFCANGLTASYTVNIDIGGTPETLSDTACVSLTRAYDFTQSSYTATLSYSETATSRSGSYVIILTAPEAPAEDPGSSSNIGGIVGGICGAFGGVIGGAMGFMWWKKKKARSNNLDSEKSAGVEGQSKLQTEGTNNGKTIPGRLPPINATKPSELGETPKTNIKESPTRKKKNKRRNRDSGERESEDPPTENLKIEAEDSPRPLPQRSPRQVTPAGDNGFNASLTNPHGVHTNFNTQQGGLGDISYNRPPSIEVTRGASRPLPEIRGKQF